MNGASSESMLGMLVYSVFLLLAVFIGPLEAVLGLAFYWLLGDEEKQNQSRI